MHPWYLMKSISGDGNFLSVSEAGYLSAVSPRFDTSYILLSERFLLIGQRAIHSLQHSPRNFQPHHSIINHDQEQGLPRAAPSFYQPMIIAIDPMSHF